MRTILLLLLLLFVMAGPVIGAGHFLYGSAYYTASETSNGREAAEYSGYVTLSMKERQYFTLGFSGLNIDHVDWDYRQQMFCGGAFLNRYPWGVKAYAAHIDGDYDTKAFEYSYQDKAHLGSVELLYSRAPWWLGVEAVHYSGEGSLTQRAKQFALRVERPLSKKLWMSLRPNYSQVMDGRDLFSASAKFTWQPQQRWLVKAGGFAGERAYYFDNDLLVLYNQNETQRGLWFGQIEYRVGGPLWMHAQYIRTEFSGFSTTYTVAGLRSRFAI